MLLNKRHCVHATYYSWFGVACRVGQTATQQQQLLLFWGKKEGTEKFFVVTLFLPYTHKHIYRERKPYENITNNKSKRIRGLEERNVEEKRNLQKA